MRSHHSHPAFSFFHPHGRHGHGHRGGGHGHGDGHSHGDQHEHGGASTAMKRLLAHGDLRFVVLLLVEEKPRHGYEIIKLIEAKSSGQYAPSPGVIYPTLTYLEETGWLATKTQDDKKQYSITPEGKAHLDENREVAASILQKLEEAGAKLASEKAEPFEGDERSEIRSVFHAIKAELKTFAAPTEKTKKAIADLLRRALEEIQKLKKPE